ncbi:Hypothetical protein SMAX5B_001442 [Scophthalmus maximus]|uniref:Uncharacterized protein n=1 Tax=Scophthalmus maximus TaxID=52904 RepID=A0A2U9B1F2_SCOMX|nr:Hypothetical protein SMAX5B_001442 [Scophthalmus maximus]
MSSHTEQCGGGPSVTALLILQNSIPSCHSLATGDGKTHWQKKSQPTKSPCIEPSDLQWIIRPRPFWESLHGHIDPS